MRAMERPRRSCRASEERALADERSTRREFLTRLMEDVVDIGGVARVSLQWDLSELCDNIALHKLAKAAMANNCALGAFMYAHF